MIAFRLEALRRVPLRAISSPQPTPTSPAAPAARPSKTGHPTWI